MLVGLAVDVSTVGATVDPRVVKGVVSARVVGSAGAAFLYEVARQRGRA